MAQQVDYDALKRGGFMRQKQRDHFSLRLHVVGGSLTADELAAIAKVAERFGNGTVHLTSRQGVEIPFVRLEDVEAIREALAKCGLRPGVCGPRVRTVTACQGNVVCPSASIDCQDIARKLDERYYGVELPHKFKFGVTGCRNNCLKAEENDCGIKGAVSVEWIEDACIGCGLCEKACRDEALSIEDRRVVVDYDRCTNCGRCARVCPVGAWNEQAGFAVSFGGQYGNFPQMGRDLAPFVRTEEELFALTDAAIGWFRDNGKPGERLGTLLNDEGWDGFETSLKEAVHG